MPDINYVNPKIKNIANKELSIQVSLSGFSFLIKASGTGECLCFRNYPFEKLQLIDELIRKVESILNSDQYLNDEFNSTRACYVSQKATLIPAPFFRETDLKKQFEFNHNLNEYDELHFNYLDAIEAYCLFSLPSYLSQILHNSFSGITFRHQVSNLISICKPLCTESYTVGLSINSDFFDILVFENKQLLLHNSFQFTNSLDFAYFFMYPLKQLKIAPEKVHLLVFGEITKNKQILNELKGKVYNLKYPEPDSGTVFKNLSEAQKLNYYSLF
jgi:hypothetical protein